MTRFVTGQSALVSSLRCFAFAKFLSFYLFEPHSPSSHMYTHDYVWKYTITSTYNLFLWSSKCVTDKYDIIKST